MSAKSWAPGAIVFASLIYQRANTGKMFVANGLPALWLAYFYLNPYFILLTKLGALLLSITSHITQAWTTRFI